MIAIYNQIQTKFVNGTISNVSLETAIKMFIGKTTATAFVPGTAAGTVANLIYNKLISSFCSEEQ